MSMEVKIMSTKKTNNEIIETEKEIIMEPEPEIEAEVVEDSKQDLEPDQKTEEEKPVPRTGKIVNAKFVRFRKAPSTTADVIAVLSEGDTAEIIGKVRGYYKVYIKNEIGFVASQYFKED
jgi:hypothetical protein